LLIWRSFLSHPFITGTNSPPCGSAVCQLSDARVA
jgi:hypothetical protein